MKTYIKPEVEVISFVSEDVTTLSGGVDPDFTWPEFD